MQLSHGTWFLPVPMLIRLSVNLVVKTNNEICSDKTKGSVPFILVSARTDVGQINCQKDLECK